MTLRELMKSRGLSEIDVENLTIAKETEHIEAANRGEINFTHNRQSRSRMDRHRILCVRDGVFLPNRDEHIILCRALCVAPDKLQFEIKDEKTGVPKIVKPDYPLNFLID